MKIQDNIINFVKIRDSFEKSSTISWKITSSWVLGFDPKSGYVEILHYGTEVASRLGMYTKYINRLCPRIKNLDF